MRKIGLMAMAATMVVIGAVPAQAQRKAAPQPIPTDPNPPPRTTPPPPPPQLPPLPPKSPQ